ncbi:MAG: response regulator transcription factor [Chloroflexi bacterium]|nr:response regulator transcription factor [Chloroflexota bacterium]
MNKIRVLVVDDQHVIREGIVAILSFQPNIEVVGQARDGSQAVEMAQQVKPDVILLDLMMPVQDGRATIPIIKKLLPDTRILVLTSYGETDLVYSSIKAGALGYLLKDATYEQLLYAINEVARGESFMHPSIAMKVIQEIDNPTETLYTPEPLTPREMSTLKLIARGLSNQEIAQKMYVNERTIAKYVSSILSKLHLANRTQVALYALREGISNLSDDPVT